MEPNFNPAITARFFRAFLPGSLSLGRPVTTTQYKFHGQVLRAAAVLDWREWRWVGAGPPSSRASTWGAAFEDVGWDVIGTVEVAHAGEMRPLLTEHTDPRLVDSPGVIFAREGWGGGGSGAEPRNPDPGLEVRRAPLAGLSSGQGIGRTIGNQVKSLSYYD